MARLIGYTIAGEQVQFEVDATPVNAAIPVVGSGGAAAKQAAASSGAASLNKQAGVVTTESLTTAAGADYTLTLTNPSIGANDIVMAVASNGSNSAGDAGVLRAQSAAGSVAITLRNFHASAALNGTLKIGFYVIKQ